jgi:hypothetical protein
MVLAGGLQQVLRKSTGDKTHDQVGTLRVRENLGQPAQQMKAAIIRLNPGTLNPIAPAVMRIEPLPQAVVSEVHTTALLYFTNF